MNTTITNLLDQHRPGDNPYLAALRNGELGRSDFLETQIQFYYAVVFFSRPMAVLAAKIPSTNLRTEILRNVWEEHGEGAADRRHGTTFLEFLKRIGDISLEDVEARPCWPEIRAFNTALAGCCSLDDWQVSAGCLGIIERMFADISAWIGQSVVERGLLDRQDLVHYSLHEKLDIKHSDDFFAVLEPVWAAGERERYLVEQGLQLGAYLFDRLYRDLFAARARRGNAPMRRPQPNVYAE